MNPGYFAPACSPSADLLTSFWTLKALLPATRGANRLQRPGGINPQASGCFTVSPPAEPLGQHSVPYGVRPDFSTFWTRKFCKSPEISYRQLGDTGNHVAMIPDISN